MAWITLLQAESLAGSRVVDRKPPPNAAKFEIRCNWDNASRVDPNRHLDVDTVVLTKGTAIARAAFPQAVIRSSGDASNPQPGDMDEEGIVIPDVFPGTGVVPVPLPNWSANKSLEMTLLQFHDNGGSPMNCGLQIRWFDASGASIDANGNPD